MVEGPWGGALWILTVTAVGALLLAIVLHARSLLLTGTRVGRFLHLLPPPPPVPLGMPLERIARDLRRLRPQTVHAEGVPVVRHRAALAAYDDALGDACRALGIETDLQELREGLTRDTERLRVEVELEQAGVRLHRP